MKDMSPANDSSLARFLRQRGHMFTGFAANRAQNYRINLGVGYSLALLGLALSVGVPLASGDPSLMVVGLGPIFAGIVNIGVGHLMKRQVKRDQAPVALTPEARAMIQMLSPVGFRAHHGGPRVEFLSTDVRLLIEKACFQANRTFGVLQPLRTLGDATATRLSSTTERAVDEAMAEVFHYAALLHDFPESPQTPHRQIEARTRELEELANRLERLSGQVGHVLPTSSSTMSSLLEELRLQDLALRELNESEAKHLRLGENG